MGEEGIGKNSRASHPSGRPDHSRGKGHEQGHVEIQNGTASIPKSLKFR